MPLYQVTLQQGRTDTFQIEAKTFTDCKLFLEKVTTAKIRFIKEIEYTNTKDLLSSDVNYDLEFKAYCKTKRFTNIVVVRFPKKGLTLEQIKKSLIRNILVGGEKIEEILNVMIKVKK